MSCLKCGRDAEEVFCEVCLEKMDERPIRNAAVVMMQRERDAYYARKQRPGNSVNVSEEKLARAGRKIFTQRIVIILLLILLICAGVGGWYLYNSGNIRPLGQNYTVAEAKETAPPPTDGNVSRETIGK